MDNQKHRKIQKKKKRNSKAIKVFKKQQQVPQDLQQFEQNEGIFMQMIDQNLSKQNNNLSEEAPQSVKVEKNCVKGCEFNNGYIFILKIGSSYRLVNSLSCNIDISIIDGLVNINGENFANLFLVKQQSSIVLTAAINQQANKRQIQINKNIKQIGKHKQKSKNKKVENQNPQLNKNLLQISRKIQQKMKVSQVNQQIYDFLVDYESSQNILIWTQKSQLQVFNLQDKTPWKNIDPLKYITKGQTTMLIGQKNTGKSIFCEFLLNEAQKRKQQLCVLDIDIGRNRIFPGCVSFTYADSNQNRKDYSIWIGEYTPLNNLSVYFKAISQFFNLYKEKYFTSSLILNTMGYLTGVGELIIYEVFNILKPQRILTMQSISNQQQWSVKNVTNCIKTGEYTERLYFQKSRNQKTSTKIQTYLNLHAQKKSGVQRFQSQIARNSCRSLEDLLNLILLRKLVCFKSKFALYQFTKNGVLNLHQRYSSDLINLRLLILGYFYKDQLVLVEGFGFGWNGQVYYDPELVKQSPKIVLMSEGIDFQKSFYNINQFKMIQLQNKLCMSIPYILPIFKTLGNKGMRNNSSRKGNINKT